MDIEIGRFLAEKAMCWREMKVEVTLDNRMMYWVDANGKLAFRVDYWRPDEFWQQCGLVIEAMRCDGWEWRIHDNTDDTVSAEVRRYRADEPSEEGRATDESECRVRMMAAALALGWKGKNEA